MVTERLIGIVGPCSAGKSTLAARLAKRGIYARHIAQEHSFVPDMWVQITHPDILLFLDVSYEQAQLRRRQNCTKADHLEQYHRLRHAREHADFYLDTDSLTPAEVEDEVLAFLSRFPS